MLTSLIQMYDWTFAASSPAFLMAGVIYASLKVDVKWSADIDRLRSWVRNGKSSPDTSFVTETRSGWWLSFCRVPVDTILQWWCREHSLGWRTPRMRQAEHEKSRIRCKETVWLQRAVPMFDKFTVQLSGLYFRHHIIRERWQCAPR